MKGDKHLLANPRIGRGYYPRTKHRFQDQGQKMDAENPLSTSISADHCFLERLTFFHLPDFLWTSFQNCSAKLPRRATAQYVIETECRKVR